MAVCQTISRKSINLPFIPTEHSLVIKERIPITPNQLLQTVTGIFVHSGLFTVIFFYQPLKDQTTMNQHCNLLRKKYHLLLINQKIQSVFVCQRQSLSKSVSICVAEIKSLYRHQLPRKSL